MIQPQKHDLVTTCFSGSTNSRGSEQKSACDESKPRAPFGRVRSHQVHVLTNSFFLLFKVVGHIGTGSLTSVFSFYSSGSFLSSSRLCPAESHPSHPSRPSAPPLGSQTSSLLLVTQLVLHLPRLKGDQSPQTAVSPIVPCASNKLLILFISIL